VFDKDGKTRTSRWASGSFFYGGSCLELKKIDKGKIVLRRDDFFYLHGGLAAVVNDKCTHAL
jgi:hypothetical protein